ncbi:hypothetical protein VFPPC_07555 [Pochonia chlamydosporia 170]|uniref:Uncharacterized protein n=1 Tax=Pochonia chlamydosporia 170 TaxID=1380566 RepID=A0A179FLQ4_METCM|nr:hypothetical protein VFPPC_07555 [Pochonia chlamydosporia 170]OAQ65929.1 hypothetical protein VFPPC_07555 [Pochonia chlamydosporia 170]
MVSLPYQQWMDQVALERERIMEDVQKHPDKYVGCYYHTIINNNVKKSWLDQGIWRKRWRHGIPWGCWRHEEPSESDSEADVEHDPLPGFNLFMPSPQQPDAQRRQQTDEQRESRKRKRQKLVNASRPFNQFNYQVARESERLEAQSKTSVVLGNLDVNTVAYQNVKKDWKRRNIWDNEWDILPGASWKHERPVELPPAPQVDPPHDDRLQAPTSTVFGWTPIFESPSTRGSNTRSLFGAGDSVLFPTATGTRDHHAVDIQAEPHASSSPPEGSPSACRRHSLPTQASLPETHSPPSNPDEGEPVDDEPNPTRAPLWRSKRLANATKEMNNPSGIVSRLVGETVQPSEGLSQPRGIGKRKCSSQQRPRKQRKRR